MIISILLIYYLLLVISESHCQVYIDDMYKTLIIIFYNKSFLIFFMACVKFC